MRYSHSSVLLAAVAVPLAGAFPTSLYETLASDPKLVARAEEILKRQAGASAADAFFDPTPTFIERLQYVNVSKGSGHEYVAPSKDDLRGPCPGLNAFANHNFLPHNGYATVQQYIDTTEKVVGMGPQLAGFLAIYGGIVDGDGFSWSMGGTPSVAQGGATGIFGHGLTGSHNKYEVRVTCTTYLRTNIDLHSVG